MWTEFLNNICIRTTYMEACQLASLFAQKISPSGRQLIYHYCTNIPWQGVHTISLNVFLLVLWSLQLLYVCKEWSKRSSSVHKHQPCLTKNVRFTSKFCWWNWKHSVIKCFHADSLQFEGYYSTLPALTIRKPKISRVCIWQTRRPHSPATYYANTDTL